MLKNSDWIVLNSIIYKIHSTEDLDEMRTNLLTQLSNLFDYNSASFYIASSNGKDELTSAIGFNYPKQQLQEFMKHQSTLDYSEGITFSCKNIVYRVSDLVPDTFRITTGYYNQIYEKNNWHYSLHINLCYKETFLGTISFFRDKGKDDFTYQNIFVLDTIKDHLAFRLYNEKNKHTYGKLSISECAQKYGLSKREICVLKRLITEKTIEEISQELVISINTLRKHISSIYRKIGINSRIQLFDKVVNC